MTEQDAALEALIELAMHAGAVLVRQSKDPDPAEWALTRVELIRRYEACKRYAD